MQPSPLLIIARGCFCTVEADLSGQDKDCMTHKAEHTNCGFLQKEFAHPRFEVYLRVTHPAGKETGVSFPNLLSPQG